MAAEMKTDRFIWGTVEKVGDVAEGALHLWQRNGDENKVDLAYRASLTDPDSAELREIVNKALMTLTGGRPMGSVDISAGDVDGEIFVDGVLAGTIKGGAGTVAVPWGDHKIELRAPGYVDTSAEISVEINDRAPLFLSPVRGHSSSEGEPGMSGRTIGGIAAVAAGGALIIGGLAMSLTVNGMNNDRDYKDYKENNAGNVCDAAKDDGGYPHVVDICNKAGTYEVLQFVFYGLGVVSAGIGTYLLVSDGSSEQSSTAAKSRLQIGPSFSRSATSLDVRFAF